MTSGRYNFIYTNFKMQNQNVALQLIEVLNNNPELAQQVRQMLNPRWGGLWWDLGKFVGGFVLGAIVGWIKRGAMNREIMDEMVRNAVADAIARLPSQ